MTQMTGTDSLTDITQFALMISQAQLHAPRAGGRLSCT